MSGNPIVPAVTLGIGGKGVQNSLLFAQRTAHPLYSRLSPYRPL